MTDQPITGLTASIVVVATGPDRVVARAAEHAARQMRLHDHLVVLHDCASEHEARQRLPPLDTLSNASFVATDGLSPGAARNRALRSSTSDAFLILDGSEGLPPGYLNAACDALAKSAAAFATTQGAVITRPRSSSQMDLMALLEGPWSVAAATVFRRSFFDQAGRFDEALPDHVDWDLLLTLVETNAAGIALDLVVTRYDKDDVRLHEALRAERHLPSIRQIFAKHRSTFERHHSHVLTSRDALAKSLWRHERALVAQRDQIRSELTETLSELAGLRERLRSRGREAFDFGDLRRTSPVSRNWGFDRGRPIDRYYIEGFVATHADDIRGSVLELLDADMTTNYGGDRVTRSDVLDIDPGNYQATIIADLRSADQIESETYDCFILTQTLHLIDDIEAALQHAHRILKPGGILLATFPCISKVSEEHGSPADQWRLTATAARRLFESAFLPSNIEVESRGNVLTATAFLYGLACEDVDAQALDVDDSSCPLIVTVRASKAAEPLRRARRPTGRHGSVILLFHRVASVAQDYHHLAVSPEVFRSQLEYLAGHCQLISLHEMATAASKGRPLEGAVALTFDDGYLDNLETAVPLLMERDAPATFFLTSERLLEPHRFWWDELEAILLHGNDLPSQLELRLGGVPRSYPLHDNAARRSAHDALYLVLKSSTPVVRDDIIRQLHRMARYSPDSTEARPMIESEAVQLAGFRQIEIGGHSVHHLSLPELPPDQLFAEVFQCKSSLERVTARSTRQFAYPFGDLSPKAIEVVRASGFEFAVTCEARPLRDHEHPYRLPRLQAPAFGGTEFGEWISRLLAPSTQERLGGRAE